MYANTIKTLSLLSIVALCCLCSAANATLVHYWPFDNPSPLADEGTAYRATILTTTQVWMPHDAALVDPCTSPTYYLPPTQVTGKFGQAYSTGSTQPPYSAVRIGSGTGTGSSNLDGTFPPPPLTISLWFKPLAVPTGGSGGDNDFLVANYNSGTNNDRLYINFNWPTPQSTTYPNTGRLIFSVANKKDQGINVTSGAGYEPVSLYAWHHAFMTVSAPYQSAGLTVVDVSLVTDGKWTNAQTVTAIPVYDVSGAFTFDRYGNRKRIGSQGSAVEANKSFMGILDDMAIWNEALPLSQAAFIYNSGIGRRANVGSGRVAYDPTPEDRSTGGSGVTQLKWYNTQMLTTNLLCDVYLSTSRADIIDANGAPRLLPAFKVASDVAATAGAQTTITPTIPVADSIYWMVLTKKVSSPADPNNAGPAWKFDMTNAAPLANAGPDKYTYVGAGTTTLSGTVTDDGLPVGAAVTCTWKDSGGTPISTAIVKTGNSYACTATVTVGAIGTTTTYTLEGSDTTGTGSDAMDVKVYATPCSAAQADPSYARNTADINNDCFVNFKDFALTVSTWKVCTALDAICN